MRTKKSSEAILRELSAGKYCLRLVETSERQGLKQLVFGCPDMDGARRRLPNVGIEIVDDASDDHFLALNPETTRSVNLALTAARDIESGICQAPGPYQVSIMRWWPVAMGTLPLRY